MSFSKLKPTLYTGKSKENQLLNTVFSAHDLTCGCEDPPSHLTLLLIEKYQPTKFTKEDKKIIQKWHTSIQEEDTTGEDETGLQEGELDALFAEDTTTDEG